MITTNIWRLPNAHYYVSDTPDNFDELEHRFLGEYAGGPVEQIAIETY